MCETGGGGGMGIYWFQQDACKLTNLNVLKLIKIHTFHDAFDGAGGGVQQRGFRLGGGGGVGKRLQCGAGGGTGLTVFRKGVGTAFLIFLT